jgi:REP-associated tyrosine transposase
VPRQPRLDSPGLVHHVMARGIEGQDIYRDDQDREDFLQRLDACIRQPGCPQLYAWALMSNHFHLLLRSGEQLLSPVMRRLMTGHAVSYNRRYKRRGHLFQNRYKSIVVEEEAYFLELVRYIHLNPVRAGIVKTLEALDRHPFSGHAVLSGQRDYLVQNTDAVLSRFSRRHKLAVSGYRQFVGSGLDQGTREELRGGGLVRSAGGLAQVMLRSGENRELADERILGSGDFVASVLQDHSDNKENNPVSIEETILNIEERYGVKRKQFLGPGRGRAESHARRQFYYEAYESAGITKTMLGRMTGRSHVAVMKAIERVSAEKERMAADE